MMIVTLLRLLLVAVLLASGVARSQDAPPARPPAVEPQTLTLFNRPVATFRSSFLGAGPEERVEAAQFRLRFLLSRGGTGKVDTQELPQGVAIRVDGAFAFVLTPADANVAAGQTFPQAVAATTDALSEVIEATRESRDLQRLGTAALHALGATLLAGLALWGLRRLRGVASAWMVRVTSRQASRLRIGGQALVHGDRVRAFVQSLLSGAFWLFALLILYEWLGYVLSRFPYTRPWGEQLTLFLFDTAVRIVTGIAHALPNLVTALVIFVLARFVARSLVGFFDRVESGAVHVDWLDAETARPTRRIANAIVWIFALAMAYPYLPGANTDAFKGVSVLVGLMLSLGGASVVGQAFSGLILMYTRTLHTGEYVRIGDNEGTIVEITLYMTRIRTGLGEELALPNSLVLSSVVRNYSRAVKGKGWIVDTTVTIGYDTPWRQVHAMLIEAAKRTPGVLADPPPRVFQTALSDFYPEYRLVCQAIPEEPRPRAEVMTALHQNVQDVFNEYGVQIMSPHYLGDPADAKVVPPERWRPAPAAQDDVPARRTG